MPKSVVSVVIPTRNRRHLIDVQLVALACQNYQGIFEVIVADNGSTDGTLEHITTHPLRDQLNMRWVDASGVAGAAHTRNAGADHATGDLLMFCDDDDRVRGNWITRMVEFMATGYDVAGSAFDIRLDPDSNYPPMEVPVQPEGIFAPALSSCSLAARAGIYRKLGGMDITYTACEDNEFGWRAAREGYRVGYLPEVLVDYRVRSTFRDAYRGGTKRGDGKARLLATYPNNGLPPTRLLVLLVMLVRIGFTWTATGAQLGMLTGLTLGELRGGIRYRSLRL